MMIKGKKYVVYGALVLVIVCVLVFAVKLARIPVFERVEKYIAFDASDGLEDGDDDSDDGSIASSKDDTEEEAETAAASTIEFFEESQAKESESEEPEEAEAEQEEKVVVSVKTPEYSAEIVETGDEHLGRCMRMDGRVQWCEYDEHPRHETLVHGAIAYLSKGDGPDGPKRVLIVGGSDCLALREVVKYEQLERVVIVDDDERLKSMCEEHMGANAHRGDARVTWVHLPIADGIKKQPANAFDLIIVDVKDRPRTRNITLSPSIMSELRLRLKQGGVLVVADSSSKPLLEDMFSYTHTLLFPSHATRNIERVILCSETIDLAKKKITGAFLDVNKIFTKFYRPTQSKTTASAMLSTLIPARVQAPVTDVA